MNEQRDVEEVDVSDIEQKTVAKKSKGRASKVVKAKEETEYVYYPILIGFQLIAMNREEATSHKRGTLTSRGRFSPDWASGLMDSPKKK